MPIAGNNVECIPMQIVDGELIEYAKQRIPTYKAMDVTEALEVLRQNKIAYVKLYGSNVLTVRSMFRTGTP